LQKLGTTVPVLFLLIGAASALVALAIWKTMPNSHPSHPEEPSKVQSLEG